MRYTYFFIAISFYAAACFFAEVHEFGLSMGLAGAAAYFFINSYLHYKKEKFGVPKMENPPRPPLIKQKFREGGIAWKPGQNLYCFQCEIEMPVKENKGRLFCGNCGLLHV